MKSAECHPDRKHKALGLCDSCYVAKRYAASTTAEKKRVSASRMEIAQGKRMADCHTDRRHCAKGMCVICYDAFKHKKKTPEQRDTARAASAKWRADNPERELAHHLKAYGMSIADFTDMSNRQQNVCAGCLSPCTIHTRLSVDHCHVTNKVRGLLCSSCNTAIGGKREDPAVLRRLADYLVEAARVGQSF